MKTQHGLIENLLNGFVKHRCIGGLLLLYTIMLYLQTDLFNTLKYERANITLTGYYRLITSQLVHINIKHFTANISALIICYLFAVNTNQIKDFCLSFIFCLVATGLGVHYILTDVSWIAGSSGFLHGVVFVLLTRFVIAGSGILSWSLLTLFVVKLASEFFYGSFSEDELGFTVIYDEHLMGAFSGVLYLLMNYILLRYTKTPIH